MPNSKPKNGTTTSQDYMNLIYTDSDSDTVPDLNLPPLKGKKTKVKTKTRKNPTLQHQPVSVTVKNACSTCTVMKIVVGTVVSGSMVALAVTCYWLMQQITDLRDQINSCEWEVVVF
ncbi:hypothetical protein ACOMHN_012934 [Nucella lapillus]